MNEHFVGRQAELASLDIRLAETQGGVSRIVLIEGPGGVGKTALIREFLARADRHRSLTASGEELETTLRYGVLGQWVATLDQPLPGRLSLEADQATEIDPVRTGTGLIELLSRLLDGGPIILVLDDAQWADPASLQALGFALRRQRAGVLTLLSIRDDGWTRLPASLRRLVDGETGARLRLPGLGAAELRSLGAALGAGTLSRRTAVRLRHHTDGNPLQVRALLEELPTDAFRYHQDPLPAPRSFSVSVLARLAACPPETERLVVAAAVLGTRCPFALAASLAELDDPLRALEHGIDAELLTDRPTPTERLIVFPHPLVRAAVYHGRGPARRAALHARAAQLVEGEHAILQHRVAATTCPAPRLAAEAAALARRQARSGAWTAAADNLLDAARLVAGRAERERHVLEAIDYLLLGGSATEAAAFADELMGFADSARRDYILARLAMVEGRHADAKRLLIRASKDGDLRRERDLAAAVTEQLALHSLVRARGGPAVTWATRMLTTRSASPAAAPSNLVDIIAVGLAIIGRAAEALACTAERSTSAAVAAPGGLDGIVGRGLARMWTDDFVGARRDLTCAVAAYRRRRGPLPWGLIGQAFLAEVEYRLGAWDDAIEHAERAVSLAEDTDQDWLQALVHAVSVFPLAGRGARQAATEHAAAAARHRGVLGTESSAAWVATAQALLALADGNDQDVVAALAPLRRLPTTTVPEVPVWQAWRALAAEALVGLGRLEEAETVLAPAETLAATLGLRSARAAAARARGALEAAKGYSERATAAFRAGLHLAADLPAPFDHALLEAAYGRFLRRSGQRRAAVTHLEAASTRFARLGARPFLERCNQELAACGRTPAKRTIDPISSLTPQELVVARLVAAGHTNRQAAAELVISVKTIEYHLGNAYAKLGVASRTQLAQELTRSGGHLDAVHRELIPSDRIAAMERSRGYRKTDNEEHRATASRLH